MTFSSVPREVADQKALKKQQRKAFCLSFLMIMLAQTSYIGILKNLEPTKELADEGVKNFQTISSSLCSGVTRTSGDPIYVDSVNGNDSFAGTAACPKKTLGDAVSIAVDSDEIILYSGLYHENVTVDGIDDLVIKAATGATVVFDGTRSITDDLGGVWSTADSDRIQ